MQKKYERLRGPSKTSCRTNEVVDGNSVESTRGKVDHLSSLPHDLMDNLGTDLYCDYDNGVLVNASDIFSCRYTLCAEYVTVGMSVNGQEVLGRRSGI